MAKGKGKPGREVRKPKKDKQLTAISVQSPIEGRKTPLVLSGVLYKKLGE